MGAVPTPDEKGPTTMFVPDDVDDSFIAPSPLATQYRQEGHPADASEGAAPQVHVGPLGSRITATDREEHEACEAGTPGCSVDHRAERVQAGREASRRTDDSCDTW